MISLKFYGVLVLNQPGDEVYTANGWKLDVFVHRAQFVYCCRKQIGLLFLANFARIFALFAVKIFTARNAKDCAKNAKKTTNFYPFLVYA